MNRGDRREPMFRDDADRERFPATLGEACRKTNRQVHAYCLMANDFHPVLETPQALPPEQRLREYRCSSWPAYLKLPGKRPGWLRVERLVGEYPRVILEKSPSRDGCEKKRR
jgi:REP element-mobilizing transposase RayT